MPRVQPPQQHRLQHREQQRRQLGAGVVIALAPGHRVAQAALRSVVVHRRLRLLGEHGQARPVIAQAGQHRPLRGVQASRRAFIRDRPARKAWWWRRNATDCRPSVCPCSQWPSATCSIRRGRRCPQPIGASSPRVPATGWRLRGSRGAGASSSRPERCSASASPTSCRRCSGRTVADEKHAELPLRQSAEVRQRHAPAPCGSAPPTATASPTGTSGCRPCPPSFRTPSSQSRRHGASVRSVASPAWPAPAARTASDRRSPSLGTAASPNARNGPTGDSSTANTDICRVIPQPTRTLRDCRGERRRAPAGW